MGMTAILTAERRQAKALRQESTQTAEKGDEDDGKGERNFHI